MDGDIILYVVPSNIKNNNDDLYVVYEFSIHLNV